MNTSRYKGYLIMARPYRIAATGRWTVDLEIRHSGRRQAFSLGERFGSEYEAQSRCTDLAHRIVDGAVPGSSIDHLRTHSGSHRVTWPADRHQRRPPLSRLRTFGMLLIPLVLLSMGFAAEVGRYSARDHAALWIAGISVLLAIILFLANHHRGAR